MHKILVVDDERTLNLLARERLEVRHCRDAYTAWGLLQHGTYDAVWLDHDMGAGKRTGGWLARQIEGLAYSGTVLNVKEFVIHSANPIGRAEMYQALSKFYNVRFVRAEDYTAHE